MNKNNISQDNNENFLINLLNDFYNKIIKTNDFNNFEIIFSNWIKNAIINNNYKNHNILNMMKNHKQNKFWFTSLIGFFYQLGIYCKLDKDKAVNVYLSLMI